MNDPILRSLHERWASKATSDQLPSRTDFDPIEMPDLLPAIYMIDVVSDANKVRFRFRLVGTEISENLGRDDTGVWIDEIPQSDLREALEQSFKEAIEARVPRYGNGLMHVRGKEHVAFERLLCPLASDGSNIDLLIGAMRFGARDRNES